jgi:hypothetical protein
MRTHHRRIALIVAAGTLLAFGSCSESSPAPTSIPRPGGTTTPVTVVGLEIGAPESIAPGTTSQLTVRERKSDGSADDVTSRASYTSTNSAALVVDATGVASGRAAGEARITARFNNRSATTTILVLPPGTFRLSGRITEGGLAISGVSLLVLEGTGQGTTATSNFDGFYALYGVAGTVKIHGKRSNYENLLFTINVAGNTAQDLELTLDTPRDPIGGLYTLTIGATGCGSLPAEAQNRRYDAVVEQRGALLTVTLSGADFVVTSGKGNRFSGTYNPDGRIVFTVGGISEYYYYYYYYGFSQPDVVERFSDGSLLLVNGSAITQHDGNGIIAGTLGGQIALSTRLVYPHWPYTTTCFNARHRFELRRK